MQECEIVVVGAARTPIGTFGGSLKDVRLAQLATVAVKAAVERSRVPPEAVGHLVMGNVVPTEPRDVYLGRVAGLDAGLPKEVPGFIAAIFERIEG
jgi:acetyl-CoA C-acetyltransferase